jgi:hypothetical protein
MAKAPDLVAGPELRTLVFGLSFYLIVGPQLLTSLQGLSSGPWCLVSASTSLYTVNPALLASSYVWQIQLYFLHISLFKIIKRKYFIQSKCEFMKFLLVLLDKIKILPLYTVYLPHQLLHMLFFTPFRNF